MIMQVRTNAVRATAQITAPARTSAPRHKPPLFHICATTAWILLCHIPYSRIARLTASPVIFPILSILPVKTGRINTMIPAVPKSTLIFLITICSSLPFPGVQSPVPGPGHRMCFSRSIYSSCAAACVLSCVLPWALSSCCGAPKTAL